ncbi:MAG: hypothetical protein EX271_00935 [Acidimicrobiales bacterium]|nr:hypothetical protein [Hyphomonadaceae bacterium]RZV44772.1 MAG: hypothetical protein EX271_00935 [Acidimicrobiales bacterium]
MSSLTDCNAKISEIIYILKEESKLIKKGTFSELDRTLQLKSKCLTEFDALVSTLDSAENIEYIAPQIETLKRLANENAQLLQGAFHGIKAAQMRLRSLATQEAQLGAYNRTGDTIVLIENTVNSEKRV